MKIYGLVTSGGEPVPDARIRLRVGAEDLAQVSSDNNGRYAHTDGSNYIGQVLICRVEKDGYKTKEDSLSIEKDHATHNVELTKIPTPDDDHDDQSWFEKIMEYKKAMLGIALLLASIFIGWLINEWSSSSGPQIVKFSASPKAITKNEPSTLEWETQDATEVTLNGKKVKFSDKTTEKPAATSTYTLTARDKHGREISEKHTVTVKIPPIIPSGKGAIVNVHSKLCLTVAGGGTATNTTAVQYLCDDHPSRSWNVTALEGTDTVKITNVNSGLCLTIAGGGTDKNTAAVQYQCDSDPSRRWRSTRVDDRTFRLVNVKSNLCLTIAGGGTDKNTAAVQYPCDGDPSRDWQFRRAL